MTGSFIGFVNRFPNISFQFLFEPGRIDLRETVLYSLAAHCQRHCAACSPNGGQRWEQPGIFILTRGNDFRQTLHGSPCNSNASRSRSVKAVPLFSRELLSSSGPFTFIFTVTSLDTPETMAICGALMPEFMARVQLIARQVS